MLLVNLPANIFGCSGGDENPYDYYISFFHQELPDTKGYHSFYYTSYNFIYDTEEHVTASDVLSEEWAAYCGASVTVSDAKEFVFDFPEQYIDSLLNATKNKKHFKKKDPLEVNSMSNYFLKHKDSEALVYIDYAKKVQPYVIGDASEWESISRDSVAMDSLIKNGQQLFAQAKKEFIKLKYGYQLVRLAHYSKRYDDAIKWYDEYVAVNKTQSILQTMSIALKAGALHRIGKEKEAALLFSKAFTSSQAKRISNYLCFTWCTNLGIDRAEYLSLCKTDEEKASMLILFALTGGSSNQLPALKEIYKLDPGNPVLEVLVVREIEKLEETYLTPILNSKKGGSQTFLYSYVETDTSGTKKKDINDLADFLHTTAQKGNVSNPGLFEISAAYASLIKEDYEQAKTYLDSASKMKLNGKLKDQLELTKILLTVNSKDKIDAAFEQQILPSIKWLEQKANADSLTKQAGDWDVDPWKDFYRNLLGEVIAKKYDSQGDYYKEELAIGASETIYGNNHGNYSGSIIFLHNYLESMDVKKLYNLLNATKRTEYENYLVNFSRVSINDVTDFIGTAYLREYNYAEAIEWFKKNDATSDQIDTNPFKDLLYDQVLPTDGEIFSTTKLAFATEMQRLEKLSIKDKKNEAKYFYKMALGIYNMTYYGSSWALVQYDRSGSDNYTLEDKTNNIKLRSSTAFTKEYYGCYKAHDYFKKAMDASTDKNFKARCLFMMAKCFQKTVQDNNDAFTNSKYFPKLIKEFGKTAAYKEIFNSCSYLRDFVKKK